MEHCWQLAHMPSWCLCNWSWGTGPLCPPSTRRSWAQSGLINFVTFSVLWKKTDFPLRARQGLQSFLELLCLGFFKDRAFRKPCWYKGLKKGKKNCLVTKPGRQSPTARWSNQRWIEESLRLKPGTNWLISYPCENYKNITRRIVRMLYKILWGVFT